MNKNRKAGDDAGYRVGGHAAWFNDVGVAEVLLPRGADVFDVRAGLSDGELAIYVIEPAVVEHYDRRKFYRARLGDPVPPSVGRGDYIKSITDLDSGQLWHIFAGQYDRGAMTKELPAQHRAITKASVLVND